MTIRPPQTAPAKPARPAHALAHSHAHFHTTIRPRLWWLCLSLAAACALPTGPAQAAGPAIPPAALNQPISATVLSEIESQGRRAGLSSTQLQSLISALRSMKLSQVRDLGEARNVSQLERLIPGASAVNQPAAFDPSRPGGSGAGSSGGSALQQGVQGQLSTGPGQLVTGRAGQLADGDSCAACPNSFSAGGASGQAPKQVSEDGPKKFTSASGATIMIYPDGSASIQNTNGTTEYINSGHRIVDRNGAAKEPLPDSQARSNRITALDLIAMAARQGGNRTPNPDSSGGGTGGGLSGTKADPVGSRATFIDTPAATRVDLAALSEVIRIAVEKLGGPIASR